MGATMYNGIINIYKEAGFTSHDVVAKMRGILKQKKIGHTGTLDPDAVGVLPVCLGSGTKLCDMLTDRDKEYVAGLLLGKTTDTQDISGAILSEKEVETDEKQVRLAIASFVGNYAQIPPMYSALKINGKKLYELARAGKEVERAARDVTIHEIRILSLQLPLVSLRVSCSKGTYIRTLCHDIGEKLGCGGVMASLERTRAGMFTRDTAVTLSQLEELAAKDRVKEKLLPVDSVFSGYRAVHVRAEGNGLLQNGNAFYSPHIQEGGEFTDQEQVRVYSHEGSFCAVYQYEVSEKKFRPVKMFLS